MAPGKAVPLHPEAVAFAGHYDFDIDVLAAYRPTGKGRTSAARRAPARPASARAIASKVARSSGEDPSVRLNSGISQGLEHLNEKQPWLLT